MYTYLTHYVYIVTTVRLTDAQKRKLEGARKLIAARRGQRVSQGDTIERLVDFAMEHSAGWAEAGSKEEEESLLDDPLLDPNIGWNMGPTDHRTVDRLLYGRR